MSKSINWFLYDRDIRHESVKPELVLPFYKENKLIGFHMIGYNIGVRRVKTIENLNIYFI